jgi:hypothetical protein
MQSLEHCLDRIENWLRQNNIEDANSIHVGLNDFQIVELIKPLPLHLPHSVIHLFQKINGESRPVFFTYPLISLEEEIEMFIGCDFYSEGSFVYTCMGLPLFAICRFDSESISIICDEDEKDDAPICYVSDLGVSSIVFTSLLDMMLTLADMLESDVFYYGEHGILEIKDKKEASKIYKKYNSGILNLISKRIKFEAISRMTEDNDNIFDKPSFSDNILEQCYWLNYYWPDITLEQLGDAEAIAILLNAAQDENNFYVQHNVRLALEHLNYSTGIIDELWQKWLEWYEKVKKGETISSVDPGRMLMDISEKLENTRARPPQQED